MRWTGIVLCLAALPAAAEAPSLPPPVEGFPIGWCLRVQGTTLEEAKGAGFEYVEMALQDVLSLDDAAFDALVERLHTVGIPARAGYNLLPNEMKVVGPDVDRGKLGAHLRRALARVARLGLSYVVFGSGKSREVPEGYSRERAYDQLVDFSRRLADEAKKHKLTVLVQPLRKQDTNLVNTVPEALALIEKVRRPNFHMLVDYSFMVIGNEDPGVLRDAGPHVRHVWVSNPNGRVYPMASGEADYASFFRALKGIGYRGGISVQARTDAFAADAPRAITFLRGMARTLGSGARPSP